MSSSDNPAGADDEFDRIVEHLDLDLDFPADPEPAPEPASEFSVPPELASSWSRSPDPVDDEPFYRRVDLPARPLRLGIVLAWAAIAGAPIIMTLATLSAYILPRSVMATLTLLFVAGAIYLFNQLPERGPADPDSPDDGAVL